MRQNINTSRKTYKIRSDVCSEEKVKPGRGWWWYQALFEVGRNQNEPGGDWGGRLPSGEEGIRAIIHKRLKVKPGLNTSFHNGILITIT